MQHLEICQTLIGFINSTLLKDDHSGLTAETPLLELGIISSLKTLKLVVFIKKQFSCTIPDEKVNAEHFHSIDSIAKLMMSIKTEKANSL